MALSVVTPSPSLNTNLSIGSPYDTIAIFESDKMTLVGETIQLRLALFANPADPDPTEEEQTICYNATYPATFGQVAMLPTSLIHATRRNVHSVVLSYVTNNTFSIQIRFLMLMDDKDFNDGLATDNVFRFEKNAIDNPLSDDNTVAGVYNEIRQLKMEVTNWDGSTAESAIYEEDINARFWCGGNECCPSFYECIVDPISDWAYQLYRDASIVTGFSAYENTNLKFQASFNAGNLPSRYYVGIYRKDNYTNNSQYWTDVSFSYAVFNPTMAGLSPSPFSTAAFAAGGAAMTNLIDDVWEADVEFDYTYFTANATYRVFFVVLDDTGNYYSCNTLDITANGCPPANLADIESQTWQYDSGSVTYTADSLINVATRGRIRIDMRFDVDSYDDNIITNGLTGSYAANLKTFGTRVSEFFPSAPKILTVSNEIPVTVISESATIDIYRVEFQVPEDWSGEVKYIVFIWNFDIVLGSNTCQQQLRKVVKLQMRTNDEDLTNYFTPVLTDQNDDPISVDEICADTVETIQICFEEALEDDYDFIQVTRLGSSGLYTENDEYSNTPMSPVINPLIESAEADTDDGDGCMIINLDNFTLNNEVHLGGVFIAKTPVVVDPCDDIDYDATTTFVSQNDFETVLTYEFDLAPLADADVLQVEVNYNPNGEGWQTAIYNNTATSDPILYIEMEGGLPLAIIEYIVNITLVNGCTYQATHIDIIHLITPGTENNTVLVLSQTS